MTVEDRLREARAPGERAAEERAWRTMAAAFRQREPARRRRPLVRLAVASALAAAVAVPAALTPAGAAVADWVREVVRPRSEASPPALPAPGRVLADTPAGTVVLRADGSRRLLDGWRDATWSPRGLFVAAVRGRTLAALTPGGDVRWTVTRPFELSQPAWAPDGYTVAYRSKDGLRAVAGDGTGDRFLTGPLGPAAPVWSGSVLLAADRQGRVLGIDARTSRLLWRSAAGPPVVSLSASGGRVAAVSARRVRLLSARGELIDTIRAAGGERFESGAVVNGRGLVLVRRDGSRARVTVGRRTLFAAPGAIGAPVVSPDRRWMLVAWAGDWVFLPLRSDRRAVTVDAARFGGPRSWSP